MARSQVAFEPLSEPDEQQWSRYLRKLSESDSCNAMFLTELRSFCFGMKFQDVSNLSERFETAIIESCMKFADNARKNETEFLIGDLFAWLKLIGFILDPTKSDIALQFVNSEIRKSSDNNFGKILDYLFWLLQTGIKRDKTMLPLQVMPIVCERLKGWKQIMDRLDESAFHLLNLALFVIESMLDSMDLEPPCRQSSLDIVHEIASYDIPIDTPQYIQVMVNFVKAKAWMIIACQPISEKSEELVDTTNPCAVEILVKFVREAPMGYSSLLDDMINNLRMMFKAGKNRERGKNADYVVQHLQSAVRIEFAGPNVLKW